ncbi:2'-5' RNA ligase [Desulfuromonas soudanensis]|uniref:RNA 2',3'-cyclic phosphodiesterase n=1 Tax=Desulfuromonas soudanensis TaxID=1603606 RepID=A0A0M3QF73_9BACT|nr:RNA 2',3'-cyclic phosphodiesterase [Desulfuromonas soudanensis]ALC15719.1 2'-5' RNA ligase [Desulfuromonas soudanensis]
MSQIRAFLAVPLPPDLQRQIARLQNRLAETLPDVRWVRPGTIHLTLKFFGELPEESLDRIGEVVLSIGHLSVPFQARLIGVGAFPSPLRPRVIWLGVDGGPPLAKLQDDLESALEKIGIPRDDRPFTPHLTLGRRRGTALAEKCDLAPFKDATCGELVVDSLVLFESRLEPGGALHLPRKTVGLGR